MATVRAEIDVPDSVTFDWVDMEITTFEPTRLLPQTFKRHLTAPRAELRLLHGTYRINVSRVADGPEAAGGVKLALDHIESDGRSTPAERTPRGPGVMIMLGAPWGVGFVLRRER